ncbi:MAG: hypothetical protein M1476_01235 [Candidatus Thermoplasmatota archaeon]|nr:hypothetical protein [Candidatus Thermoplasmatota archaeon]
MNNTTMETVSSGSFFGSLNYTDISLGSFLFFSSLHPGNYTIVARVFSGGVSASSDQNLQVIPHVKATISGPSNINDSLGSQSVTYFASVAGGEGTYSYSWTITSYSFTNIQSYSEGSNTSSSFSATFYKNSINSFSYGENATYYISLSVTDSLGYSYSIPYPGYTVNVTGN